MLLSAAQAACEAPVDEPVAEDTSRHVDAKCGPDGYVQTELFGALAGEISWDAGTVACEGMPRPDGDGARLRFAGTVAEEYELAFIVALPDLAPGEAGKELLSTVTIIEEGAGRFFSNADQDSCWTDIHHLEAVAGSASRVAIEGALYCVAPLVEINGTTDITLGEFRFRGLLDWDAS